MITAKQARYIMAEAVGEKNRQLAAQDWLKRIVEPLILQASKRAINSIRVKIPDEFGRTAINLLTDLGYIVKQFGEENEKNELKLKCIIYW